MEYMQYILNIKRVYMHYIINTTYRSNHQAHDKSSPHQYKSEADNLKSYSMKKKRIKYIFDPYKILF